MSAFPISLRCKPECDSLHEHTQIACALQSSRRVVTFALVLIMCMSLCAYGLCRMWWPWFVKVFCTVLMLDLFTWPDVLQVAIVLHRLGELVHIIYRLD